MKGEFKKVFFAVTALFILTGGVIIVMPLTANRVIAIALGCVLVALGAVKIANCWKKDRLGVEGDSARGLLMLLLGVLALKWSDLAAMIVLNLIGAALIVDGFTKLQLAFAMKRASGTGWKRVVIGEAIFMAVGLVLLCAPAIWGAKAVMIITGIVLILSGIGNIWVSHELSKAEGSAM